MAFPPSSSIPHSQRHALDGCFTGGHQSVCIEAVGLLPAWSGSASEFEQCHGRMLGNIGKMLGKYWENLGKCWENLGKCWENLGKIWENVGKYWEYGRKDLPLEWLKTETGNHRFSHEHHGAFRFQFPLNQSIDKNIGVLEFV